MYIPPFSWFTFAPETWRSDGTNLVFKASVSTSVLLVNVLLVLGMVRLCRTATYMGRKWKTLDSDHESFPPLLSQHPHKHRLWTRVENAEDSSLLPLPTIVNNSRLSGGNEPGTSLDAVVACLHSFVLRVVSFGSHGFFLHSVYLCYPLKPHLVELSKTLPGLCWSYQYFLGHFKVLFPELLYVFIFLHCDRIALSALHKVSSYMVT